MKAWNALVPDRFQQHQSCPGANEDSDRTGQPILDRGMPARREALQPLQHSGVEHEQDSRPIDASGISQRTDESGPSISDPVLRVPAQAGSDQLVARKQGKRGERDHAPPSAEPERSADQCGAIGVTETGAVPSRLMPSAPAVPGLTSMTRPRLCGPRSRTWTVAVLPFSRLVT